MPSVLDPLTVRSWDRQRDEPPAAWFAFKTYRDARGRMTYTELADIAGVSTGTISGWAQDWGWKLRLVEYERSLDADAQAAARALEIVNAETMAAKHLEDAARLREVARQGQVRYLEDLSARGVTPSLSALALAAKTATDIERTVLGKHEAPPVEPTIADYSKLSDEEFAALVKLQRKALGQ